MKQPVLGVFSAFLVQTVVFLLLLIIREVFSLSCDRERKSFFFSKNICDFYSQEELPKGPLLQL